MRVPPFCGGWFARGCLLALPLWLIQAGCGLSDSGKTVQSPPPPAGPATPETKPPQNTVIPAAAMSLPPTTLADGMVAVRVVAYVNKTPVFESELREAVAHRMGEVAELVDPQRSQKLQAIEKAELDKLIEREVIYEEAYTRIKKLRPSALDELQREAKKDFDKRMREMKKGLKLQTDDQLQEFFAANGLSIEGFRRQLEHSFISNEYMRNLIFPKLQAIPLAEVHEYYDRHPDEFQQQDRVKWQDIFLDSNKFANRVAARQFADQVAQRLRQGEDFKKVSQELSKQGVNMSLGDVGVGEQPGEINPPELSAALLRMKPKEVGDPIEMPGGFHIVRVNERTYKGRKPLDAKTQSEILVKLQNAMADREFKKLVDEMKTRVVIQYVKPQ
ncbi:MAG TPA: peptidyl-prolyl cis-trans isomerase [Gemmataceae bacterium]|nr:peptidyl-prolyl cis-trans isomerase [Gemmataceae bacterium]